LYFKWWIRTEVRRRQLGRRKTREGEWVLTREIAVSNGDTEYFKEGVVEDGNIEAASNVIRVP